MTPAEIFVKLPQLQVLLEMFQGRATWDRCRRAEGTRARDGVSYRKVPGPALGTQDKVKVVSRLLTVQGKWETMVTEEGGWGITAREEGAKKIYPDKGEGAERTHTGRKGTEPSKEQHILS